jgi:hypothetical protein
MRTRCRVLMGEQQPLALKNVHATLRHVACVRAPRPTP